MISGATPTLRLALACLLVSAAVIASMLGMTVLVEPPWTSTGVAGILAVTAALLLTRLAIGGRRARVAAAARANPAIQAKRGDDGGRGAALPTLIGLLVGAWFLLAHYGIDFIGADEQAAQWLPTIESVDNLVYLLGQTRELIFASPAPLPGAPPLAVILIGGAMLVLLVADMFAVALRRPLIGGFLVIALWLPSLALVGRVPWWTFAATTGALLLGLTLDGPVIARRALRDRRVAQQVRRAGRLRTTRTLTTVAAVTVIALFASAATGGLPTAFTQWARIFRSQSHNWRMSDHVDVRDSLRERSNEVVFSYRVSTGQSLGPLRLEVLTEFDGLGWVPASEDDGSMVRSGQVLESGGWLNANVWAPRANPVHIDLTVGTLAETRMPLPLDPRSITAGSLWWWDPQTDTVHGNTVTTVGDQFSFEVHPRNLNADVLRATPSGAYMVDARYRTVPVTSYEASIRQRAAMVAGDATNDFDRALALQSYLRSPLFSYDYEVPDGLTGDPVWDFLVQRQGFCIQFATAMVIMARTLGIPARMVLGFLPGTLTADGIWRVTGMDAHAWPEIYFPGSGWVRFEPTPAQQTGAPPAYADPSLVGREPGEPPPPPVDDIPNPDDIPEPRPPQETTPPTQPPTLTPPTEASGGGIPTWAWLAGGGLLGLALLGAVLIWLRRRTPEPSSAEDAWGLVVTALVKAGISLPPDSTPRRAPAEIAAAWRASSGEPFPEALAAPIATLATAVEAERYAPTAPPLTPRDLTALTHTAISTIRSALS